MRDEEPADPWGAAPKPRVEQKPAAEAVSRGAVASVSQPPVDATTGERVRFAGVHGEWLGILFRGLLLYIPTFGFYRFWLRTDQRRFLWRSISLRGDVLEYRGTARELLTGFLFAIAVYVPISVAYALLGIYAETLQAFASIPFFLFMALFGYYASFRARRYRLTRTVFRGVRFWMDGSAWRFAFLALGWLLATGVTLGLAWPWMQARLEAYKMKHSHFGNLGGEFDGKGWDLFKALIWPALGTLVVAFIPGLNVLAAPVILSIVTVVVARWRLSGTSFGPVRLGNDAYGMLLAGPALVTLLAAIVFLAVWIGGGVAILLAFMGTRILTTTFWHLLFTATMALLEMIAFFGFIVAWAVIGLLFLNFIKMALYDFQVVKRLAEHTLVSNVEALDGVIAKGQAEGSFGEGLADALGSDGF